MRTIVGCLSALICMAVCAAAAAGIEKTIEASGEAAVRGSGPDALALACEEAVNRAQRRAIEMGVGTVIDSETMVENFQLLDDRILSQVKGYITGYRVLKDNRGAEGVYRVTIEATVALARLEKDVRALNIIKAKKGNPRIMVVMREYGEDVLGDDTERAGSVAQTAIEKEFLKLGFPLVDKTQMERIDARDAALAAGDPAKAAALGRRYGADIVIAGEATSGFMEASRPHGVSVYHFDAQASAKAVKVDTGRIIARESAESGRVARGGRRMAARDALKIAGEKLARAMRDQLLDRWRSEAFNRATIEIVASGADNELRRRFEEELGAIRGVRSVSERSWVNNVLVIDCEVDGAIWKDFDRRIENLTNVGVKLTARTQNRIDVTLSPKGNQAPAGGVVPE